MPMNQHCTVHASVISEVLQIVSPVSACYPLLLWLRGSFPCRMRSFLVPWVGRWISSMSNAPGFYVCLQQILCAS